MSHHTHQGGASFAELIGLRRKVMESWFKKEKKPLVRCPKGLSLAAIRNFWVVQILKMFPAFLKV
jgi:hypothetical protein